MTKAQLAKKIREVSYLTGQFKLRSGQVSTFYWDKYRFEARPELLDAIAGEMQKLLPKSGSFSRLAGMELGGVPLATAISLRTGTPSLFVRKTAKNYGTQNLVEGDFEQGETVVVIEDVITTAGQVARSVRQMRELGVKIDHVVCAIDRQQGGAENLKAVGCSLSAVFTLKELEP